MSDQSRAQLDHRAFTAKIDSCYNKTLQKLSELEQIENISNDLQCINSIRRNVDLNSLTKYQGKAPGNNVDSFTYHWDYPCTEKSNKENTCSQTSPISFYTDARSGWHPYQPMSIIQSTIDYGQQHAAISVYSLSDEEDMDKENHTFQPICSNQNFLDHIEKAIMEGRVRVAPSFINRGRDNFSSSKSAIPYGQQPNNNHVMTTKPLSVPASSNYNIGIINKQNIQQGPTTRAFNDQKQIIPYEKLLQAERNRKEALERLKRRSK
jgi:hypothetical protein